jgi:uncharacterized protein
MNPAAPVSEQSRLNIIDALRGVALLGILAMNIPGFSMPDYSSESYRNDPSQLNFWLNAFIGIVMEGKMRAMFGMLFGAGVLLFVASKEKDGKTVHGLFYRRMMWLLLFGILHAHLILWIGDILYLYGVCGMIVYLFRNLKPKHLAMALPLVALIDFASSVLLYQDTREKRIAYLEAKKAETEGRTLTALQTTALSEWRELEKTMIPNREDAKANTAMMKSDYGTVAGYLRPIALKIQTQYLPLEVWDSVALMFLGMALLKWGFFTGTWNNGSYWKVMGVGYGLGLAMVSYSFYYDYLNFSTLEANLARMEKVPIEWVNLIYPFQRILLVMAHASALILLYQAGKARGLFLRLEAVGRMAFSNYIMHSVICTFFFFGYGLNYYGTLEFYRIYYVVVAIWALQLFVSPLWLKHFYFGPLEWLWRSLTYWKMQPMRRGAIAN